MGIRNNALVHSAITRQLLEKKIRKQGVAVASIGGSLEEVKQLTAKVNQVQNSLTLINNVISSLSGQVNNFINITNNIQNELIDLQENINSLIDSSLQKYSYLLVSGGEGIISHVHNIENNQDTYEVINPFNNKDIVVQVVELLNPDKIVDVSVEIEQQKVTLNLAHCEEYGQFRVLIVG